MNEYSAEQTSPFVIQIQESHNSACAICRAKLLYNSLCLKVDSIYQFPSKAFQSLPIQFCLKEQCLSGINEHRRQKQYQHTYPRFLNCIAVDREDYNDGVSNL